MNIQGDTISFKSHPGPFADERDGIKPNTIRLLSPSESQKIIALWGNIDYIVIEKTTDSKVMFKRKLSDISDITGAIGPVFKKLVTPDKLYVFSWKA